MLNRSSERADLALAGVRAVAKAHDKAEYNISLVPCDLQDFQSVRTAAAALRNQYNIGIDVLCNNAAYHNEPSIDGSAGADEGHGSHLGHFLLTLRLLSSTVGCCLVIITSAVIYLAMNMLSFVALARIDAATFSIVAQMKIFTTAIFAVLVAVSHGGRRPVLQAVEQRDERLELRALGVTLHLHESLGPHRERAAEHADVRGAYRLVDRLLPVLRHLG